MMVYSDYAGESAQASKFAHSHDDDDDDVCDDVCDVCDDDDGDDALWVRTA